jgi:hypothetical protein
MVCNVHNTQNTDNQENIIFRAKMFTSRFIFLTVQIVKMLDVRNSAITEIVKII